MKLLLDTCTIIWAVAQPEALSKPAKKALIDRESEILVSPISCAELACAVNKKRITLDRHWKLWFRHFVGVNNWEIINIDLPIIEESYSLADQFHADPADRIIVATSRLHKCPIVTADKKLRDYAHVETVW